jgi:uncharacterized membrane protein YbhN (UPF0104 family)
MPTDRTRTLVTVGTVLAVAGIAAPMALGIHLHVVGLLEAALGATLLICCSALALNGSRPQVLPARQAVPAVLATTAANAVTPAGIGGALLVVRLHRRSGLSGEQAVAAAAVRSLTGALVATVTTVVVALSLGTSSMPGAATIGRTAGLLALVVVGAALAVPALRRRVLRLTAAVFDLARNPRCLASLVLGCAGVTLAQLLTLQGAVNAVGGHVPWAELLATLMGSAAARSAVPSPGGVGPVEAALVGGLSAVGLGFGTAAAAVAVYRTAGHWLPVLGGVLSMRQLRRAELV